MPRRLLLPVLLSLFLGALALRSLQALPTYAVREGYPCRQCHVDPNGGGVRNDFGFNYGKNRHMLVPPDTLYNELTFSNKITDGIWFGTDFRLLLATEYDDVAKEFVDRTFIPMQGAMYVHAQPIPQLDLVYNRDLRETRDAYGLITGWLPWDMNLKVGQFRTPLGLRFDDHTAYTKRPEALGYNYQEVDQGIELSHIGHPIYWQAALQNGGSARADLTTLKIGYVKAPVHLGISGQYNPGGHAANGDPVRRLRAVGFGGVRAGRFGYAAELMVGQDRPDVGALTDTTTGVLGYSGELTCRVSRPLLLRAKFDFLNPNTKFDKEFSAAEASDPGLYAAHRAELLARKDEFKLDRFGIEADYQPYPFVEFKTAYRFLQYQSPDIANMHQVLVLTHFSF